LVTLEIWQEVQEIAKSRQGSRMAGANPHPATRRTYALRHYVHHVSCDKRMFGKSRKGLAYYCCSPQLDRVGNPQDYADHPRTVYVREDRLLDCVQTFFAQRVLGRDRAELLRHQMDKQGTHEGQDHKKRIAAVEKTIAELGRRQDNLMEEREAKTLDDNDEVGRAWAERLRARFADLENQRRAKQAELDQLRIVAERERPQQPELLDLLPQLTLDLADAPDPLQRGLYEACGMKIHYDHATRNVTIRATLRSETVPAVEQAANTIALTRENVRSEVQIPPQPAPVADVAHVLRVLPGAQFDNDRARGVQNYGGAPFRPRHSVILPDWLRPCLGG
jgi:hypothetical protein